MRSPDSADGQPSPTAPHAYFMPLPAFPFYSRDAAVTDVLAPLKLLWPRPLVTQPLLLISENLNWVATDA